MKSPGEMILKDMEASDDSPRRYALLGILALAAGLRLMGLSKGLWFDETFSLHFTSMESVREMLRAMRFDTQPPLYFLLLRFWSMIGTSEEILRLLSVSLSLGTLVILLLWLRQYSAFGALVAGLLMATTPLVLRYSQELRVYPLLLCATVLALFFASRIAREPHRGLWYAGVGASLTVAVLTHLVGIFLILPVVLYVFMDTNHRRSFRPWYALLTLGSILAAFCVVRFYFLNHLENFERNWWMPAVSIEHLVSVLKYACGFSSPLWMVDPVAPPVHPALKPIVFTVAILGFVMIGIAVVFGKWKQSLPFLAAAIAYWLELITYSIVKVPILMPYTALPGLVPFFGFVGLQIASVHQGRVKRVGVAGIFLVTGFFAITWAAFSAWQSVDASKQLSQMVQASWRPNDVTVVYPDYCEVPLKYYFPALPVEAIVPVPLRASEEELDHDFMEKLDRHPAGGERQNLFVIVRMDPLIENNLSSLRRLFSAVASHRKEFSSLNVYMFTSMGLYNQEKLFESRTTFVGEMEPLLGRATATRDFFTLLCYQYVQ